MIAFYLEGDRNSQLPKHKTNHLRLHALWRPRLRFTSQYYHSALYHACALAEARPRRRRLPRLTTRSQFISQYSAAEIYGGNFIFCICITFAFTAAVVY